MGKCMIIKEFQVDPLRIILQIGLDKVCEIRAKRLIPRAPAGEPPKEWPLG